MTAYQHTNRRGDVYYLQSGKTKTGKPRYYLGRKLTGAPVERVPDGYEIWENPANAQVYVRKFRPSPIIEAEREFLEEAIRTQAGLAHFVVDIEGPHLVVYLIDQDPDDVAGLIGGMFGAPDGLFGASRDWAVRNAEYSKMMRFTLVDEDERIFAVERWCFRGSIDDWSPLFGRGPLPDVVDRYVEHLGQESFYELI